MNPSSSSSSSSVASVLAASAARRPAHPALVFGDRSYSYGELWDGALRYAAALRARGLGPGDRVALLLPNTPDFPMAYYGTLALGCTAVPVHEDSRAPEIGHVLRDSGARALICAGSLLPEAAAVARSAGVPLLGVGDGGDEGDGAEDLPGSTGRRRGCGPWTGSSRAPPGTSLWSSTPPVRPARPRASCSRTTACS